MKVEDFFSRANSALLRNFVLYCVNEFSAENPVAYGAMLAFKSAPSDFKAGFIYNTFFVPKTQWEVNLDGATWRALNAALDQRPTHARGGHAAVASATVFDKAMFETAQNLLETFTRFTQAQGNGSWNGQQYFKPCLPTQPVGPVRDLIRSCAGAGLAVQQGLVSL